MSLVPVCHVRADAEGTGFDERILHAGHLLLHRHQRLADHPRPHPLGTQIANGSQLDEVGEAEMVGGGDKPGALPTQELVGADAQDAKDVGSTVLIHGSSESAELSPPVRPPQWSRRKGFPAAIIMECWELWGKWKRRKSVENEPGRTLYDSLWWRLESRSSRRSSVGRAVDS